MHPIDPLSMAKTHPDSPSQQDEHPDPNASVLLSIVVPVYNEEENIELLYQRVKEVIENRLRVTFEIIFVDDGSRDASWQIIQGLNRRDSRVHGLRFSRNFGHQLAVKAGLDASVGRAVISMDGDLQHPPALIERMVDTWREGYDTVTMFKTATEEVGFMKNFLSILGYKIINFFSDFPIQPGGSDFRLMDRQVVNQLKCLREDQLLLRSMVNWLGFRIAHIPYQAEKRFAGRAQYTFRKSLALVVSGVMSFSTAPLRFVIYLGMAVAGGSFFYSLVLFIKWLTHGEMVQGWLTIVLLILLMGGTILIVLGIIGEYVARIYENSKQRPSYIIQEQTGQTRAARTDPPKV
ncbi:MAG: glycosyltransferase family 2 protein [Magnetococcales bacterium]|nr:glycosyltransferase family 2 protein [Magnetococcales bacterium]